MTRLLHILALTLVALSLLGAPARAQQPITYTTIYVHDMHCSECAKKIARRLYAIPGVVEVRADVNKNIAYVVPQKDKQLSAKSMWEAVEGAGFKVARLDSPQGSFAAKPVR